MREKLRAPLTSTGLSADTFCVLLPVCVSPGLSAYKGVDFARVSSVTPPQPKVY